MNDNAENTAYGGYTLNGALQEFAAPELLKAFKEAREAATGIRVYRRVARRVRGEPLGFDEYENDCNLALIGARGRAERALVNEFRAQLLRGELIATAMPVPLPENGKRSEIAPALWQYLEINWRDNAVAYQDRRWINLSVQRRVPVAEKPVPAAASMVAPPLRRGGRVSQRNLCLSILETRFRKNSGLKSLSREADWIVKDIQANHPEVTPPKASTVRNNIRIRYRDLKSRQQPD